jgi:uncharacterized protein YdaU (DUF1376 family)
MSKLPYMNFYWNDHLAATTHLTAEQQGSYDRILGRLWINGGSLPNDPKVLARIAGIHPPRWNHVWQAIGPLFTVQGDCITQRRLKDEWQAAVIKRERARATGSLGGQKASLKRIMSGTHVQHKKPPNPLINNDPPQANATATRTREEKEEREASPSPRSEASASREKNGQQEEATRPPKELREAQVAAWAAEAKKRKESRS